jgi:hypothetical protein
MTESRSLAKAENNGGYSWVENSFIDDVLPKLSGLAAKVYLLLIRKIHNGRDREQITRVGIPVSELAKTLKRSKPSVIKALNELEVAGAIEKIKAPGFSNKYRFLDTSKENLTGDDKETLQDGKENLIPPDKKTLQVNDAKPYGATARVPLKNSKSIKISKRVAGVGHARIASKTGRMDPEDALG